MTSTEVQNLKIGIFADVNFHELLNDVSANKENEIIKAWHDVWPQAFDIQTSSN